MAERYPTHPLFTLRTSALAGRREEQEKLRSAVRALPNAGDETCLFYIAGDGGMGKTRLLEWMKEELFTESTRKPSRLLCTDIIDFYSSHVRIALDLVEAIAEDVRAGFGEDDTSDEIFTEFDNLRQRFRSQRNAGVPGDIRQQVMTAFDAAWRRLAEKGWRLVVRLDTAELLRFHDDPVRKRFDAPLPVATAWGWLRNKIEKNELPGVLFVVAGRRREAPELYAELRRLAGVPERMLDLSGFSRQGVGEYIEHLSRTLHEKGHPDKTQALSQAEGFDDALVEVFHRLTGGSPIALAIALQLYLDRTPPKLMVLIDRLLEGEAEPPDKNAIVREALVDALGDYAFGQDASIIVRYMALARRGLTPERFRAVWTGNYQFEHLDEDFAQLQRQIFVKTRPDDSLVLHDEIADWLERGFYSIAQPEAREVFGRLATVYDREIDELERTIGRLNERTNISDEEIDEKEGIHWIEQIPERSEDERKLFIAREQRRHLAADRMSYALRWNPAEGYKHYYELAEEIFSTGLREYEAHIRAVFLEWWEAQSNDTAISDRQDTATSVGVTPELIEADFALRSVQRAYTEAKPQVQRLRETLALAQSMLNDHQFRIPPFARALLEIYIHLCRGQLEGEATLEEMRTAFTHSLTVLEEAKRSHGDWDTDLRGWLIHAARAFGYYAYGFIERTRGHYGRAARWYTASLKPYRDLKFEVSQARSLNDKAYALALVGDSLQAEAAVTDALSLRQRLGYGYPIGLSLNTYGIVLMMNERPVSAEYQCERALEIFRRVGSPYGQMLAHRALSEAYRRDAERLPMARDHYLRHLESALQESEQAYTIASNLLERPSSLLADILDEYGCVYRDLAHFCWENPEECKDKHNAEESCQRAERLLQESIQALEGINTSERRVDSAVNLAYLYYWRIDSAQEIQSESDRRRQIVAWLDEADTRLQKAIAYAPEEYRNPGHERHQRYDPSNYWTHLSKAWSLAALILQERRWLSERADDPSQTEIDQLEDALAHAVMHILYYAARVPGNVRAVRRSRQIAYDVLKPLNGATLERFHTKGAQLFPAEERDAWKPAAELLRKHLEENFGIGEFTLDEFGPQGAQ
ncbi:MAG: ATP-binding protein [Caldilineaceae bacterium]|nr:ATP-binding protein [Caldilineaceae bacterium]